MNENLRETQSYPTWGKLQNVMWKGQGWESAKFCFGHDFKLCVRPLDISELMEQVCLRV